MDPGRPVNHVLDGSLDPPKERVPFGHHISDTSWAINTPVFAPAGHNEFCTAGEAMQPRANITVATC